jgi:hypothetical protein
MSLRHDQTRPARCHVPGRLKRDPGRVVCGRVRSACLTASWSRTRNWLCESIRAAVRGSEIALPPDRGPGALTDEPQKFHPGIDPVFAPSRTGTLTPHRVAVSPFSLGDNPSSLAHRKGGAASHVTCFPRTIWPASMPCRSTRTRNGCLTELAKLSGFRSSR